MIAQHEAGNCDLVVRGVNGGVASLRAYQPIMGNFLWPVKSSLQRFTALATT